MPDDSKVDRNSSATGAKRELSNEKLNAAVRNAPEKHGDRPAFSHGHKEEILKSFEHGTPHVVEGIVLEKKEGKHAYIIRNLTKKNDITGRNEEKNLNDQRHEMNRKQETMKKDDYAKTFTKESRRNYTEKLAASTKADSPMKLIRGPDRASSHQRMRLNSWNIPNQERAGNLQERQGKYPASHNWSRRYESSHGAKLTSSTHREPTSTYESKRSHGMDHYKKQESTVGHAPRPEWREPERKRQALMTSSDSIQAMQAMQPLNSGTASNDNKPKQKNETIVRYKESYGDRSSKDDRSVHDRSRNQSILEKFSSSSTKKSDSDVKKSREYYRDLQKEVRSTETDSKRDPRERGEVKSYQSIEGKQISQCRETDKRETSRRTETCSTERKGVSSNRNSIEVRSTETDSKRDPRERGEVKSYQSIEGKQISQCRETDKRETSRRTETCSTERKGVSSNRNSHKYQSIETHVEGSGPRRKVERRMTTGTKSQRPSGNDRRSDRPPTRSSPDLESRKLPISNRDRIDRRDRSIEDRPKRERSDTENTLKIAEKKRLEARSQNLSRERDHHKSTVDSRSLQPRRESVNFKLGTDNHKTKSSTMRDAKSHVLKEVGNNLESAKQVLGKRNANDMRHLEGIKKSSSKGIENQKISSGSSVEKKANVNSNAKETVQSKEKPKVDMKREFPKSERDNERRSKIRKSVSEKNPEKSSLSKKPEDEHSNKKQSNAKSTRKPHASVHIESETKQTQLDEIPAKKLKEVSHTRDSASVQKGTKTPIAHRKRTETIDKTFDLIQTRKRVQANKPQHKSVNQKDSSSTTNSTYSLRKKRPCKEAVDSVQKEVNKAYKNNTYKEHQSKGSETSTKISRSTKLPNNDNDKLSATAFLDQKDFTMNISELCGNQSLGRGIDEKKDDGTGSTYCQQQGDATAIINDLIETSDFVIVENDCDIELDNLELPGDQPTADEDDEHEQKVKEKGKVYKHEEEKDKMWMCDLPSDIFADSVINQSEAFDLLLESNFPETSTASLKQDDLEENKNMGCSGIQKFEASHMPYSNTDSKYENTVQSNIGNQMYMSSVPEDLLNEVLQTFEMSDNNGCMSLPPNVIDGQQSSTSRQQAMMGESIYPNNIKLGGNVEDDFLSCEVIDLLPKNTMNMFETKFLNSLEYEPPMEYLHEVNKIVEDEEMKKVNMVQQNAILTSSTVTQQSTLQKDSTISEQFEDFKTENVFDETWNMLTDNAFMGDSGVMSILEDFNNSLPGAMGQELNDEAPLTIRNDHDPLQPIPEDEKGILVDLQLDGFSIVDMPMDCNSFDDKEYVLKIQDAMNAVSQMQQNEIKEKFFEINTEETRGDNPKHEKTEKIKKSGKREKIETYGAQENPENQYLQVGNNVGEVICSTISPIYKEISKSYVDDGQYNVKSDENGVDAQERIINKIEINKSVHAKKNNLVGGQKTEAETPLNIVEQQPNDISEPNLGLAWVWDVAKEISEQLSTNSNEIINENRKTKKIENVPHELKPNPQINIIEKSTEDNIHSIVEYNPMEIISFDLTESSMEFNNLTQTDFEIKEFDLDFLLDSNHTETNLNTSMTKTADTLKEQQSSIYNDLLSDDEEKVIQQAQDAVENLIQTPNKTRRFTENKEPIQLKNKNNIKTTQLSIANPEKKLTPAMQLIFDCFGDLESSFERSPEGSTGKILDMRLQCNSSMDPAGAHPRNVQYHDSIDTSEFDFFELDKPCQQQEEQYTEKKIEHISEKHEIIIQGSNLERGPIRKNPLKNSETNSKSVDITPIQCKSNNACMEKEIKTKDQTLAKPEARNKIEKSEKEGGWCLKSMLIEMNPADSVPSSRGQIETVEKAPTIFANKNSIVKPISENQLKRKSVDKTDEVKQKEIVDWLPEKKRKSGENELPKLAQKQISNIHMQFTSKPQSNQNETFNTKQKRTEITLNKTLTRTALCDNLIEADKRRNVEVEHKRLEPEFRRPLVSRAVVLNTPKPKIDYFTKPQVLGTMGSQYSSANKNMAPTNLLLDNVQDSNLSRSNAARKRFLDGHVKTKVSNSNTSGSVAVTVEKFTAGDIPRTKFPSLPTSNKKEPIKQHIPNDFGKPNTQSSTDYSKISQKANQKRVKLMGDQTERKPVDTMESSAHMSGVGSTIISPKSKSKKVPHDTAKEVKAKRDVKDRNGIDKSRRKRPRPQMNRSTNIIRTQKFLSAAQKIFKKSSDVETKQASERIFNAVNAYPIGKAPSNPCSEVIPASSNEVQSEEATVTGRILVALEKKCEEANQIVQTFKEDLSKLSRKRSPKKKANSMSRREPYFLEDMNALFNARIVRKEILSGTVIKLPKRRQSNQIQPHLADEDEIDLEEIGVPDKFQIYWPSNLSEKQSNSLKHPNDALEMATLLSIELPKITYTPALKATDPLRVSDLQFEAMMYACQSTEQLLASGQRAGFLLGDGPGIGKSRSLTAVIYENFRQGRKRSVWVSMAKHQNFEVDRELSDIGASPYIKVAAISQFSFNYIDLCEAEGEVCKKGIICITYAELTHESPEPDSKFRTHVSQLAHWLGKNGVIVFDDCHKASRMGLFNSNLFINTCSAVLKLQQLQPLARVVYVCDASISEPREMVFMTRLGLWGRGTSFAEFPDFVHAMEKLGTGAMELVAVDLKMRGMYISRYLSFHNVNYRIEKVPMSHDFHNFYNYSSDLWAKIHEQLLKAFRRMHIEVRIQQRILRKFWNSHELYFRNLSVASKLAHLVKIAEEAKRKQQAVVIGVLSPSEYENYQYPMQQQAALTNFLSTAKDILQSFVEQYFPAPRSPCPENVLISVASDVQTCATYPTDSKPVLLGSKPSTSEESHDVEQGVDCVEKRRRMSISKADKLYQQQMLTELFRNMQTEPVVEDFNYTLDNINPQISEDEAKHWADVREKFLQKIRKMSRRMPPNTLDKIITTLGGSNAVSEVTNRCGRVLKIGRGMYKYEQRYDKEANRHLVNCAERGRFLEDKKRVLIVSESACCSFSVQSIPSAPNKRPRVYVSLELPWGADRAIQQFGCTKRSNQVNEPELVMLVTDVGSELHRANMVAWKLKNLGATDLDPPWGQPFSRDQTLITLNNSFGINALDSMLQQITGNKPLETEHLPGSYQGDFVVDSCKALAGVGLLHVSQNSAGQRTYIVDRSSTTIPTFLKRIVGCRIEVQSALFKFFLNKMYALMLQLKQTRLFNLGIIDLDVHGSVVTVTKLVTFKRSIGWATANLELHTLELERGLSFDAAMIQFKRRARQGYEGFYILHKKRNKNNCAILCINSESDEKPTETKSDPSRINMVVIRPNTGTQLHTELLSSLLRRYVKASPMAAQSFWKLQYAKSLSVCSHIYWGCKCPYGIQCSLGLRVRTYHILSGSLLSVWKRVALIVEKNGEQIQIVRVKTSSNNKIVGIAVPEFAYRQVMADLSSDTKVETMDFTIV